MVYYHYKNANENGFGIILRKNRPIYFILTVKAYQRGRLDASIETG
jgi:hypothetical protein